MRRAFTLIELLVVIAIVAILAAILFPVFAQAKLAAKKTTCVSNMKQMGTSFALYLGDSEGQYPAPFGNRAGDSGWVISGNGAATGNGNPACSASSELYDLCAVASPEKGSLWPYAKNGEIYKCPIDSTVTKPGGWNSRRQRINYTMNSLYGNGCQSLGDADCIRTSDGGIGQLAINESQVGFPSTTFLLLDEDVYTRNDGMFVATDLPTNDRFGSQHTNGSVILNGDSSAKWWAKKAAEAPAVWRRFHTIRDLD